MSVDHTQARQSCRLHTATKISLVLALGLALAGCGKDETAPETAAPGATTAAPPVPAEAAVSATVSAMSVEDLREAARKAYSENRLYAPLGDNAVEYYLALRDKAPGDAAVSSALIDLLPMTVIATEQSVNRDDFTEAQRLLALLEKAEPQHPAVARLKTSIAAKQEAAIAQAAKDVLTAEEQAAKQAELEKQRLADQKKQQELAARQLDAKEAADKAAAAQKAAEDRAAAQRAAAAPPPAERPAPAATRPAATPASTPARTTAADLRPISVPSPEFPPEAQRTGETGEVQVEFTVNTDGSVSNVRIVQSKPARVFDRTTVSAVRRWRFQPIPQPVTTRRTIAFN